MMRPIYFPREDSEMLAHEVQQYACGVVLDIGTGTGIQAQAAAMRKEVTKVYGVDLNPAAIKFCRVHSRSNGKIEYLLSDLFSVLKKKLFKGILFDTIIFNPPYLPVDHEKPDRAVIGGKKGYEVVEKFLNEVNDFLAPDGKVLLLFSSLTGKQKVDEIIRRNLFDKSLVNTVHVFYETLYVYLLRKNSLARAVSMKGVQHVTFLDKGTRKIVYTGTYHGKKVAIKAVLEGKKSTSVDLEAFFLKKLNKYKIGPKLLVHAPDFLIAEFIEGIFLKDFLPKATKKQAQWLLKEVLKQCCVFDKLGINKDEMHHPLKHVIIAGKKVRMIDFERCRHTQRPKNVTQFCQFIATNSPALQQKGLKINRSEIMYHAQEYKKDPSRKNFKAILDLLENGH